MWKLESGFYYESQLKKQGVVNFTTTVLHGDMKCAEYRKNFLERYFGIKKIVSGVQTHGNNIKIITTAIRKNVFRNSRDTDGFITDQKHIPLAVFTADCLPVFIYDRIRKIIGLVHAGRAGLEKKIVEKAVNIFIKNFGSNPHNVFVAVGPHIKKCCYGVDLDKIIRRQLNNRGIKKISIPGVCTHDKKFFSYRKNKTKKRMLSVMMMK